MNKYKFLVLAKEFPFLHKVLREQEDVTIIKDDFSKTLSFWKDLYKKKFNLRVELKKDYARVVHTKVPDSCAIKRGDENLLSRTPEYDSYSWCDGGHCNYTAYYAIYGCEVVPFESAGRSRTGSGEDHQKSAPNIGEQLLHLVGINPDYIVCVDFEDTDDNGNGETSLEVIVYKMNKFDLVGYHCDQIDKAASQLKAEIRLACAGGGK